MSVSNSASAKRPYRWLRRLGRVAIVFAVLIIIGLFCFWLVVRVPEPVTSADDLTRPERSRDAEGRWHVGKNWLGKNNHGLYEVYIEGDDLQRGLAYGVLAQELIVKQEEIFVDRLRKLVPNEAWLNSLKYITAWFNRNLPQHVPLEFEREIYGVSRSFSDAYDFIGPKYHRALNYHAAHDIGHALQDLALVGCTSFAAWDSATADGGLLIARNFDFYLGEEFAKDKLITFVNPTGGIPFMTVSWGGFMGAASGMNAEGLTVTINAAKSTTPFGAKTPISLLAREILEYASTIDSAIAIAKRRDVFVSESILVGSAHDGRAVIIEKAPDGMDITSTDGDRLVCANHYQSGLFKNSEANSANIRNSDSMSRWKRMQALLGSTDTLDATAAVSILRDRKGPDGSDVGMGNPMSINQLIAHHGIVFEPEKRLVWVSSYPYQEGAFVCYDLASVFSRCTANSVTGPIHEEALTIAADPFLASPEMQEHGLFARIHGEIHDHVLAGKPYHLSPAEEAAFLSSNPRSYLTFADLGDLHRANGEHAQAATFYTQALERTVASEAERQRITQAIAECKARP
ncbi:MAG: C45 family autoproteolytic acyltransferase/hydrolase [Flavobacteriales bacterium]